ncbi:MAG: excinuclease ABC subunit A [Paracoccaceae bacterium]
MKRGFVISVLAVALAASPGFADGKKAKGHSGKHAAQFCPPGLAKKDPACIPPGQAKKMARDDDHVRYVYRIGDTIRNGYVVLDDPRHYGLDPRHTYWRVGDSLFRVNPDTGRVLATLGLLSQLLN